MSDDIKAVQANLKEVGDQLRTYAEQSQKEIKRTGEMHAETKANVDKLLVQQGELQARLQAAEQLVAKLENGGGRDAEPMSMGKQVVESEQFKAFNGRGSFSVQATITSGATSGGAMIRPDYAGVVQPAQRTLRIRDLLSVGQTGSNSVEFVRETGYTNAAAPVSENPVSGKPESNLTFELTAAPVATIAHFIHASKQVLSDAAMLQSYIDGRARYGLDLKEEGQLLKGSGVGLNLNGLYTQATAYSNPGAVVVGETAIDRIRLALLQVNLAEYEADGIVISPIDWADMELTKDSENRYIFGNAQSAAGPVLWGRPVVATQSMDAGDFLVGAFRLGAQIWDREATTVTVSTEDRDNFIKNMVTILCEKRLALAVYRPEAFVKGDFDGVAS